MSENKVRVFEFEVEESKLLANDPDTMIVKLQLLHTGVNRNRCDLTKQGVLDSIPSFYDKPIVYRLDNKFMPKFSTDVTTHSRTEEDNFEIDDLTMNIAGQIPSNSRMDFIKIGDREVLICDGIVHKRYQPILTKILLNRNGKTKVSIELFVEDSYTDERGIEVINKFRLIGVCLLGSDIPEGIEGSNLEVLQFSEDKYNQSYCLFAQKDNFVIPEEVKLFAKSGLEKRKKMGKGGCNSSISMASYLLNNNYISFEKIKHIDKYFSKHDDMDNINAMLLGGSKAKEWSNIILNENVKLKEEKEERSMAKETEKIVEDEKVVENAVEEIAKVVENAVVEDEKVLENAVEVSKKDGDDDDDEDDDDDKDDDDKDENIVINADDSGVSFAGTSGVTFSQEDVAKMKEELNALKEQLNASNEIVKTYAREKEKEQQFAIIEEFAHCFSEPEFNQYKENAENQTFAETEKEVMNAVMKFAKSQKDATTEKSFSHVFPANRGMEFAEINDSASEQNLNKFLNKNKVVLSTK